MSEDAGEEEEGPGLPEEAELEPNTIILVKFICALLFHFKFETEIRSGLKMMRYAALHSEQFVNPGVASFVGMINAIFVFLVEVINLWNLSNITGGDTSELMFDFIALGIVAEFDDYFIEIYRYSNLAPFVDSSLSF